jgi:PEP-CTERM motif
MRLLSSLVVLLLALPAQAVTVTILNSSHSTAVWAKDDVELLVASDEFYAESDLPFVYTHSVTQGGSAATANYDLSSRGFSITFEHARTGGAPQADPLLTPTAGSTGSVRFTVDQDVDYQITGMYSAQDLAGRRILFSVGLTEGLRTQVFYSQQVSDQTPNESFVLGGPGGDIGSDENFVEGSAVGTLIAGRIYRFDYDASLHVSPDATTEPATATGFVNLVFVPEPSTAALMALGMIALARWRARVQTQG